VILADLRPMSFGHNHAHQIVRLRVLRRETHGIAGIVLALDEFPFREQQHRQFVRRVEVVRVQ
jgi:hypothetical protein